MVYCLYCDLCGMCHTCSNVGLLIRAFLQFVIMCSQLHFILVFLAYLSLSPDFFSLAGGRVELAMHFTLNSEYVAMVVARDLA